MRQEICLYTLPTRQKRQRPWDVLRILSQIFPREDPKILLSSFFQLAVTLTVMLSSPSLSQRERRLDIVALAT